jgi:hypothetical protein
MEYLGTHFDDDESRAAEINRNPSLVTHHQFAFDTVYGPDSTQESVYTMTAQPAVLSVLQGYNATIFAYG